VTSYNAISGLLTVKNVTFANFNNKKCNIRDYVLSTNPNNNDGQHPVTFEQILIDDVDISSKIWIHRPNLATINPSQCVDMDCDGLKKNLFTDLDGSFLGEPGVIFSQSEWQWNGDSARGLGDYRIPKEALADANGHLRNISDVYKKPGIVRNENCTFLNDSQAWECLNFDMKLLIIESMDDDTEERRLSPVAIFSDDNVYVDLINGPMG